MPTPQRLEHRQVCEPGLRTRYSFRPGVSFSVVPDGSGMERSGRSFNCGGQGQLFSLRMNRNEFGPLLEKNFGDFVDQFLVHVGMRDEKVRDTHDADVAIEPGVHILRNNASYVKTL